MYSLVGSFPTEEKFGLVKQIRDAATSTTANIAEGFGRYHYQENIQFCRISRGSLFEILDHLITSVDSGYITAEQFEDGRSRTLHAIKVFEWVLEDASARKNDQ